MAKSNAIKALRYRLGLFGGFATETLAGDRVLTFDDAQIIGFDPAAARNVDLPAVNSHDKGYFFVIVNRANGAETITVRKTGGGATVVALAQAEAAVVYVDDSTGDWALAFEFTSVSV